MAEKPLVVVAMSGGVDSSVAAALLVEQGYAVIGMMLRLWNEQGSERANRCCTPDSIALARRVASILSIPFYVLDAKKIFYDSVITPFVYDYTHNLTPNPCIACNRIVRWQYLFDQALSVGAEYLSTGHYARIIPTSEDSLQLARGKDHTKDQSYVLHVLTQRHLKHALFPLGEYTKQEVRQLAHHYNLPVAERPESQDLCFIGGDGDYRKFLVRHAHIAQTPGPVVDTTGNVIGQHPGLSFFTIGQRKGLNVSSSTPLYVVQKDFSTNTLVVGPHTHSGSKQLTARQVNWLSGIPPLAPFDAMIKVRYKAQEIAGCVFPLSDGSIRVEFDQVVSDITPGQAAVLYNGDVCLGGGIISR